MDQITEKLDNTKLAEEKEYIQRMEAVTFDGYVENVKDAAGEDTTGASDDESSSKDASSEDAFSKDASSEGMPPLEEFCAGSVLYYTKDGMAVVEEARFIGENQASDGQVGDGQVGDEQAGDGQNITLPPGEVLYLKSRAYTTYMQTNRGEGNNTEGTRADGNTTEYNEVVVGGSDATGDLAEKLRWSGIDQPEQKIHWSRGGGCGCNEPVVQVCDVQECDVQVCEEEVPVDGRTCLKYVAPTEHNKEDEGSEDETLEDWSYNDEELEGDTIEELNNFSEKLQTVMMLLTDIQHGCMNMGETCLEHAVYRNTCDTSKLEEFKSAAKKDLQRALAYQKVGLEMANMATQLGGLVVTLGDMNEKMLEMSEEIVFDFK